MTRLRDTGNSPLNEHGSSRDPDEICVCGRSSTGCLWPKCPTPPKKPPNLALEAPIFRRPIRTYDEALAEGEAWGAHYRGEGERPRIVDAPRSVE